MKVHLFVPCMADAFVPEVGLAAADCLAAAGCEVVFDPRQTCCGQMFANSGMEREAGRLARRFVGVFRDAEYVVGPSGSCTGFVRERYGRLLRRGPELDDWRALRGRVFELTGFLTGVLGISAWAGRFESRATLHWSCHMPQDGAAQGAVEGQLRGIDGLELTPRPPAECCGFGGVFWTMWRDVSAAIGRRRVGVLTRSAPDAVLLSEPGCLMQVRLAARDAGADVRVMHVAEALAQAVGARRDG